MVKNIFSPILNKILINPKAHLKNPIRFLKIPQHLRNPYVKN